jgi:Ser/Thr protein kinase RdoA (MazF antagonist)
MERNYQTLSARGQQRRLRRVARTILAAYALVDAQVTLLKYEDTAVYRVTDPARGRFVLRLTLGGPDGPDALHSELIWLQVLGRDPDLHVPEPIPTRDGRLITSFALDGVPEAYACVLRWLPGSALIRAPSPALLGQVGRMAAHLHQHAQQWTPPPGFTRPRWDLDWLLGPQAVLVAATPGGLLDRRGRDVVAAAGVRIQTEVAALGTDWETFGLLHADLNLGNFVVQEAALGLIDFDDCGWGYYLYDLATTLCSLRHVVRDVRRAGVLRAAYLAGYDRVRSLPSRAETLLPTFMAMRELVIMTFILESSNANVQAWAAGRVAEAVARLEAYLQGPRAALNP